MVLAVVLVACGDDNAHKVEAAAVKTISQQNQEIAERLRTQKAANEAIAVQVGQAAERERFVRIIRDKVNRWNEIEQQMVGKRANELDDFIAQLTAVRGELVSISTTPCTEPRRDAILRGMDGATSLLGEFKAKKGVADPDFSNQLGEQINIIQNNSGGLSSCL